MAVMSGFRRTSAGGVIVNWDGDEVKRRAELLAQRSSFEIGLVVEGQAKLLAPVDSGRLRSSITTVSGYGDRTKPRGKGSVDSDLIAKPDDKNETHVGTPVIYGPYIEYGTVKMSAQPFLRPALDIARGRAPLVVQKGAKKEFGEYLNPTGQWQQENEAFTE
jgi:hypothetical protein